MGRGWNVELVALYKTFVSSQRILICRLNESFYRLETCLLVILKQTHSSIFRFYDISEIFLFQVLCNIIPEEEPVKIKMPSIKLMPQDPSITNFRKLKLITKIKCFQVVLDLLRTSEILEQNLYSNNCPLRQVTLNRPRGVKMKIYCSYLDLN